MESTTVMEHAIEDLDLSGTTLVVVGEGGIFFFEIRPYAPRIFEPMDRRLETVIQGRIQSDKGKIRSVRFFDDGGSVVVGMLRRVM